MITLEEPEVVWPMGLSDHDPSLADRPLVFNPKGFLVAILEDDDHAEQARAALQAAGFADRDLRVYTSQQILADHQRYLAQRSLARRVVGGLTDDTTAPERYSTAPARAAPPCGSMSPPTPTPSGSELQCNLKVEYVEKLTDGPVGVGTRYRARWANSGPTAVEVVQFDSPRRWETNAEARGMAIRFKAPSPTRRKWRATPPTWSTNPGAWPGWWPLLLCWPCDAKTRRTGIAFRRRLSRAR
jgi:hypothetical protein